MPIHISTALSIDVHIPNVPLVMFWIWLATLIMHVNFRTEGRDFLNHIWIKRFGQTDPETNEKH